MKKILLFMALVVTMVFGAAKPMEVEAKTTVVTLKKADTKTLKKIDKQLKKGKTFYLDVKGSSKTKSKKLIKKASQSIGKVNGYSVQFHYGSPKKSKKGYYRYKVSADNAKLYKYTIQLLTLMYKDENLSWTERVEKQVVVEDNDPISQSSHIETEIEWVTVTSSFYKSYGNKTFNNLSEVQKANVITANFGCWDSKYITYDSKHKDAYKYSSSTSMKRLLDGKATGVCEDFTRYQILIFDQIGIQSYYARSTQADHAVVAFKAKNSVGKTLYILSNYGTWGTLNNYKGITDSTTGKLYNVSSDWHIQESNKINKEFENNNWAKEDIAEIGYGK